MRSLRTAPGLTWIAPMLVLAQLCGPSTSSAQTDPAPLQLPYAEQFNALAHGSNAYPAGWQGWRIGNIASSTFEVAPATADLALIPSSTAAANTGGVHNYNGTIGLLNSASVNSALVLSITASSRYAIQVGYSLATIRNPYNGTTNTRINEATMQYRIGTTGDFITLSGPVYATGTTTQTGAVTTPLNVASFTRTLPATCDYQPIIQLRWVVRDASGSGGRPSIAVDAVNVTGNWFPMFAGGIGDGHDVDGFTAAGPTASIFHGGVGRGDAGDAFSVPPVNTALFLGGEGRGDGSFGYANPIIASLFQGGTGRGDVSNSYAAPPISASLFNGGIGRGDVSDAYATPAPIASIFTGGNGRGDVSNTFTAPPLTASIFSGGNGRGDVSFSYYNSALASNIYFGGNGRGDVSNTFLQAPLLSSIFSGGSGRGDVMNAYLLPLRVRLALKGFLEGPYDQATGRMRDDLRMTGLIPASEPYSALGYGFVLGGGESTSALVFGNDPPPKDRIVDWVVVELRDATDPSIVVSSRSALIQRDGDVVDLDGTSPLEITADPANYHVALRHRNHLGAMTAGPVSLDATPAIIDLSVATTPTFGSLSQVSIGGVLALWAGDVNFNGQIKYTGAGNDRDPILTTVGSTTPNNTVTNTYSGRDVNLNGQIKYTGSGNDRDPILVNVGSTTPNNVRTQQLP